MNEMTCSAAPRSRASPTPVVGAPPPRCELRPPTDGCAARPQDGDALLLEVTDVMQPLQPAKTSFHVLDNKTLVIAVTPTNALFPWGRHLIGACGKITTW